MWAPAARWMSEQVTQRNVPSLGEAHVTLSLYRRWALGVRTLFRDLDSGESPGFGFNELQGLLSCRIWAWLSLLKSVLKLMTFSVSSCCDSPVWSFSRGPLIDMVSTSSLFGLDRTAHGLSKTAINASRLVVTAHTTVTRPWARSLLGDYYSHEQEEWQPTQRVHGPVKAQAR